ncbi:MAG: Flp pilus assembly protein CpaB [Planctomycetia bacterium]|nr:Flp pilus assembly protein CpaB [Planctomycetia bacterium]
MRPKSLILLSLALGCGLVASLGINQMMSKGSPAASPDQDTEAIYVVVKDIQINDIVTKDSVKLEQWPKSKIPPDALRKLEDIEGRRVRQKLQASDVLRDGKLLAKGENNRASGLITPGYRAFAVAVDAAATAGNLLNPGDRVDVLVHLQKGGVIPETTTITFLENIKVFAVNSTFTSEEGEGSIAARTVSLELLPDQVEEVDFARQLGRITLSLRAPGEKGMRSSPEGGVTVRSLKEMFKSREAPAVAATPAQGPDLSELFDKFKNSMSAKAPQPKPQDQFTMKIFRGLDVEECVFNAKGEPVNPADSAESDAQEVQ